MIPAFALPQRMRRCAFRDFCQDCCNPSFGFEPDCPAGQNTVQIAAIWRDPAIVPFARYTAPLPPAREARTVKSEGAHRATRSLRYLLPAARRAAGGIRGRLARLGLRGGLPCKAATGGRAGGCHCNAAQIWISRHAQAAISARPRQDGRGAGGRRRNVGARFGRRFGWRGCRCGRLGTFWRSCRKGSSPKRWPPLPRPV